MWKLFKAGSADIKTTDNNLIEPVLKNIYQSNNHRQDLSWPHFNNDPRVQEN